MADREHRERRRDDRRKLQLGIHEGWDGEDRRKTKNRRLIDPITGELRSSENKSTADLKKQQEYLRKQKERELSEKKKQGRQRKELF